MKRFLQILTDERGPTGVEYAVMLGLIAMVLLGSAALVGQQTNGMWTSIQTGLTDRVVLK